ncbi:MAG: winged helix-turn-helix domain-containing protein [Proteobacteria bacterium]|nr:winged helix-turn-helix domain-containing protein [Pseudomonadota bacterium]
MAPSPLVCRFGDYRIDQQYNAVEKGGETTSVSPLVMDVLVHLIRYRDRVVSAEELLTTFWPGRIVEESTVHRVISQIRNALGDSARDAMYIRTVSKRGYQAVAEVSMGDWAVNTTNPQRDTSPEVGGESVDEPVSLATEDVAQLQQQADEPPGQTGTPVRRGLVLACIASLAVFLLGLTVFLLKGTVSAPTTADSDDNSLVPPRESVAVLPFTNLSTEAQVGFFADGLAESILDELAGIDHMRVPSRTASFRLASQDLDLQSMARELEVEYLVEGSVQAAANELRITVQLIRASDGFHVFSRTYERSLDDRFDVQAQVAAHIAQMIHDKIWEDQRRQFPERFRDFRGIKRRAVDLFLDSVAQYNLHTAGEGGDLLLANQLVTKAAEIDPNFVLAHADVAWGLLRRVDPDISVDEASVRAHRALDRILELEPMNLTAHFMREQVYIQLDLDYWQAEALYERAIALAPRAPWWRSFMANIAFREGRAAEALDLLAMEASGDLDDMRREFLPFYADVLRNMGHYNRVLKVTDEALKLIHAGRPRAELLHGKAATMFALGREQEGRQLLEEAWTLGGQHVPELFIETFARFGDPARSREAAGKALVTPVNRGHFALGYQALGEYERVFEFLAEGINDHDRSVIDIMRSDRWAEPVTSDPRFAELLALLESKETHSRRYLKDLDQAKPR